MCAFSARRSTSISWRSTTTFLCQLCAVCRKSFDGIFFPEKRLFTASCPTQKQQNGKYIVLLGSKFILRYVFASIFSSVLVCSYTHWSLAVSNPLSCHFTIKIRCRSLYSLSAVVGVRCPLTSCVSIQTFSVQSSTPSNTVLWGATRQVVECTSDLKPNCVVCLFTV